MCPAYILNWDGNNINYNLLGLYNNIQKLFNTYPPLESAAFAPPPSIATSTQPPAPTPAPTYATP